MSGGASGQSEDRPEDAEPSRPEGLALIPLQKIGFVLQILIEAVWYRVIHAFVTVKLLFNPRLKEAPIPLVLKP
jgi:hypothetical protein